MGYEKEILKILSEAGESGLSVQKIALHVHHSCNSLFNNVTYESVRREVIRFLINNSRKSGSIIEKTNRRGIYRLNIRNVNIGQFTFSFGEAEKEESIDNTPYDGKQLSLF